MYVVVITLSKIKIGEVYSWLFKNYEITGRVDISATESLCHCYCSCEDSPTLTFALGLHGQRGASQPATAKCRLVNNA